MTDSNSLNLNAKKLILVSATTTSSLLGSNWERKKLELTGEKTVPSVSKYTPNHTGSTSELPLCNDKTELSKMSSSLFSPYARIKTFACISAQNPNTIQVAHVVLNFPWALGRCPALLICCSAIVAVGKMRTTEDRQDDPLGEIDGALTMGTAIAVGMAGSICYTTIGLLLRVPVLVY